MLFIRQTSALVFISIVIKYHCQSNESTGIQVCHLDVQNSFMPSLYSTIETKKMITRIYSERKTCSVDVKRLLDPYNFINVSVQVGFFRLECKNDSKVIFNMADEHVHLQNIVGYFDSRNCSFERENLDSFLSIMNFRVLVLTGFFFDSFIHHNITTASALDKIVSFGLLSPKNNTIQTINYIFGVENIQQNMAEIYISNSLSVVNITVFSDKFPNLQSLEMTNSDFDASSFAFSWNNNEAFLPNNLTRSDYLQDHYSNAFHVDIPGNIFKRSLVLKECNILDLNRVSLTGILYYTDFSNNRIQRLDPETFSSVTGLQSVVLGGNKIRYLHDTTFNNQQSLSFLDLSDNMLSNLSSKTFLPLKKLKYLDLSNNLISNLPSGIFFKFNQLQVLHLDNNTLHSVQPFALPYFSVKLHSIYFNNNPLTTFPGSCFYIRSLKKVELRNTKITFNEGDSLLHKIDYELLRQSVVKSSSVSNQDPMKNPEELRTVDLTGSIVTSFRISTTLNHTLKRIMIILLKHFHFILMNNPIVCDCNIIPFNTAMREYMKVGVLSGNEYFYKEWQCKHPRQFTGESLLHVKDVDTYCKIADSFCPDKCLCYKRHNQNVTIVDCNNSGIQVLPKMLPKGIKDLWMNNNNISIMSWRGYFKDVHWLDLAGNRLSEIPTNIFKDMPNLRILNLDNNLLSYLPITIRNLHLDSFSLQNNRLKCDCHAVWTKWWILENINIVNDAKTITCLNGQEEPVISVAENDFVCLVYKEPLKLTILIPCLAVLAVLIILILLICVYRFEIKVLMYIYCGIHPFDKIRRCEKELVDFTVVYAINNEGFVKSGVIAPLQRRGYVLLDIHQHFLAGYSFQENIAAAVQISKHVLLIISENMINNSKLLNIVCGECQDKIKTFRANFVILVCHDLKCLKIQNKEIMRYINSNRCLHTGSALFVDKLSYFQPRINSSVALNLETFHSVLNDSRYVENNSLNKYDIFLSHASDDSQSILNLLSNLENEGYKLCFPERDFVPGCPISQCIVEAIDQSTHTVLLTRDFAEEERFVYRMANDKSLRCKYNHLIVIFLDNNNKTDVMDKDIEKYISCYITLQMSNQNCLQNLKSSLVCRTILNEKDINAELE